VLLVVLRKGCQKSRKWATELCGLLYGKFNTLLTLTDLSTPQIVMVFFNFIGVGVGT
jgi:hypothetical protein